MRQQKLQISTFTIMSQWKLYVAIATRVLNRLEQKRQNSFLAIYRYYMWNMESISLSFRGGVI